jgi:hypothetical protein
MATDEEYMAFLDKANRDADEANASAAATTTQSQIQFKTTDAGIEVPSVLQEAVKGAVYVSDADEDFVPVALKFTGQSLPDEGLCDPFLLSLVSISSWAYSTD